MIRTATTEQHTTADKAAETLRSWGVHVAFRHLYPPPRVLEIDVYGGIRAATKLQAHGVEVTWEPPEEGYGRLWRHFRAECLDVVVTGCDYAENVP